MPKIPVYAINYLFDIWVIVCVIVNTQIFCVPSTHLTFVFIWLLLVAMSLNLCSDHLELHTRFWTCTANGVFKLFPSLSCYLLPFSLPDGVSHTTWSFCLPPIMEDWKTCYKYNTLQTVLFLCSFTSDKINHYLVKKW